MRVDLPEVIEKEEIRHLPQIVFEGEIIVVDNCNDIEQIVDYISSFDAIGFDTETKPSFKKGVVNKHKVSLCQLCAGDKVFLFRLNKIGVIPELRDILANPNIKKVGAAVHDDIKALQSLSFFVDAGFIDIQNIAAELEIEVRSLRKLTAMFFRKRLSKTQRLSNWESDFLSDAQKTYAATDAWISLQVYSKLNAYMS